MASDHPCALERVNEISLARIMAIYTLQPDNMESAAGQLALSRYPAGRSPHQDRLADQFLRNSALTNRLDPRFTRPSLMLTPLQARASNALAVRPLRSKPSSNKAQHAANSIRAGDMLVRGEGEVAVYKHDG